MTIGKRLAAWAGGGGTVLSGLKVAVGGQWLAVIVATLCLTLVVLAWLLRDRIESWILAARGPALQGQDGGDGAVSPHDIHPAVIESVPAPDPRPDEDLIHHRPDDVVPLLETPGGAHSSRAGRS